MTLTEALALVALILAALDELRARGQSLTTWAVIILALVLLVPGR